MAGTTIKVPAELRDRLNIEAHRAGTSVAGVITQLLAERERANRFSEIREAMQSMTDADWRAYGAEAELWEAGSVSDDADAVVHDGDRANASVASTPLRHG